MNKDPRVFLRHIRESIATIEQYTQDVSKEEFLTDTKVQDAVFRRIEIIG